MPLSWYRDVIGHIAFCVYHVRPQILSWHLFDMDGAITGTDKFISRRPRSAKSIAQCRLGVVA